MYITKIEYQYLNIIDGDLPEGIRECDNRVVNQSTDLTKAYKTTFYKDSFMNIPEIEQYNNYSKTGTLNNIHSKSHSNGSLEKDDDVLLPWWFQKMIRDYNLDSDWILQVLEEAGLEKSEIIDWRQMKQNQREIFRQMLKDQSESARLFVEGLAEEMKMRRKMIEAFREIVQGKNTSSEGQQLLAQFAPMLLFIALLLKDENEESEEDYCNNEESNQLSNNNRTNDIDDNNQSVSFIETGS